MKKLLYLSFILHVYTANYITLGVLDTKEVIMTNLRKHSIDFHGPVRMIVGHPLSGNAVFEVDAEVQFKSQSMIDVDHLLTLEELSLGGMIQTFPEAKLNPYLRYHVPLLTRGTDFKKTFFFHDKLEAGLQFKVITGLVLSVGVDTTVEEMRSLSSNLSLHSIAQLAHEKKLHVNVSFKS